MVRGTSSASAVSSVPAADTAPRPASALQLLLTVCGAGLLVADVCADVLTSILLLTSGQLTWGAVTAVWPLLAAVVTLLLDGASVPDSPSHLAADRRREPKFSHHGKALQQREPQQQHQQHEKYQQQEHQQKHQHQKHLQQEFHQQQHHPQEHLQHRHQLHQKEQEQQQHPDLDVKNGPCECACCPSPQKSPSDVHDLQKPENGDLRHAKQRRYRGGLLHRYIALFQQQMQPDALTGSADAQRSAALCHLYQAAVQSAPQLVLQLFGVLQLRRDQPFIFVCAVTSLANLVWAVASHSRFPSIFPDNSSKTKEVSVSKHDSCYPENESLPNAVNSSKPTETISSSSEDHSNSQDRRNSSVQTSRICHSRSDSGLDNSYRGSSSLPKLIDRNLKTTSGLRSSSLPSKPGTGYQAMYLSHAFVSSGLLDVPVKRIKEHKFGSVITLKERNLMTNSSNVNVLGGNELGSVRTLDARPCSSTRLLLGLRTLSCLLLLTTRLAGLTAAAILVGPWLYMTACVHMTVMFVLVVSERPHFSALLWRDVVMSLATAVVFCTTVTPLTMQSSKWRHAVGQAVLAVENMTACALLYAAHGHRSPHLALALLVAVSAITFLGCGVLFLIGLLDQRQREKEHSDLELGCVSPYCSRHSNAATLALPEDSSSAYSGSTDSNYGSSSSSPSDELTESQTAGAPLERQTGLLCSVQDLLANMSCLNEDMQLRDTDEISHENLGAGKEGRNDGHDTCGGISLLGQHGFLTRSVDLNSEPWNSGRPLSTLGFNVHDSNEARTKESQVKSAKILLSRSFSREIQNYDGFDQGNHFHSAFKTSANYENYPPPNELVGETQGILPVPTCAANSPSSLERSVTREYDERLQEVLDPTNDVSSLANSSSNSLCTYSSNGGLQKQFPQEPNSREGFRLCESETSTSILRGGDAQHELTCVSDTDMRLINAPQTSPSSLYSSLNNSESTECDTAVEVKLHSFHRPPSSNVEHSVVRKLSSVRRKLSTNSGNKKHDYENVYEDNSNLNFESQISMPSENLASGLLPTNQPKTSSQDYVVEQKRSTGVLSRLNSLEEKECADKSFSNNTTTSPALPLPLPPRTYIIRYPYQHFPRPLLKLSDSANHSNNSSNHDYENLPPLNVNRGVFGVRHWKAYLDIEDRAHDYSTYKDKSKINSTASSSLTSDCSGLKHSSRIRKSLAEDGESVLSRSLPDLSNLVLEACIEVPEGESGAERLDMVNEKLPDNVRLLSVLNTLRATKPLRTNSVDDLSNYETIWIDEIDDGGKPGNEVNQSDLQSKITDTINTEHSSLITTIGDVKAKGSLCNLYYSRMSDLSRRFYSDTLRPQSISSSHQASQDGISQCSTNNSFPDNETIQSLRASVKVKKIPALQGISECAEEQPFDVPNTETCSSAFCPTGEDKNVAKTEKDLNDPKDNQLRPLAVEVDVMDVPKPKRKFSILRERFEGQRWTPLKSPLKFHSPAKALQAGLRVFNRPRVHIITPSDDDEIETFGGKLTSPFKLKPKILSTPPSITTNKNDTPRVKQNAKVMENALGRTGDQENPSENPHPVTSSNSSRTTSSSRMTQQTPLASSVRKVQKTPKTSTPDNARSKHNRCESSVDSSKCDSIAVTAPKHSTPEAVGNHLPQLSTISGLSSVVESPELSRISSVYGPLPRTYSSARGVENSMKRLPLSENVRWGDMVNRMGNMPSMTSIKEKENRCHEVGSLNFASCSPNSRPFQINRGIHVVDANENHYQGVPASRLNPASKNIYTIFHDQQKVLRNNRTQAGYPRLADQCYEDAVFIAPLPVSAYGITNQRSTLTPNSKIFDKKI